MRVLIWILALCFSINAKGQIDELSPCGTIGERSEWLKNYQKNPQAYDKRSDELLYVPLVVTNVGFDNGSGYILERYIVEALCILNNDYAASNIQFYLKQNIRYIDDSAFANHTTVVQGALKMFANNVEDALNIYIVSNAAGNCGYNLPYAGIALAKNCTQSGDRTISHEVGHALSLPHPFLGWEGGISHDGSIGHNFDDPAPEKVLTNYTYFKDSLLVDTLIIDTIVVETVDRSNCTYAADGFCDTPPDYLATRWNCSSDITIQTDPNGEKFESDASLIMSYAVDNCANRFSEEQMAAMRANLIDEKSNLLGNEVIQKAPSTDDFVVLEPKEGTEVYYKNVYIEWEEVENATQYYIQVTKFPNYQISIFDTIIPTNYVSLVMDKFPKSKHYFRIKPLNEYHFCNDFAAFGQFQSTDVETSVEKELLKEIIIHPTLISNGQSIHITNEKATTFRLQVTNLLGKQVMDLPIHEKQYNVPTETWDAGVYLFSMHIGTEVITQKIVVTK